MKKGLVFLILLGVLVLIFGGWYYYNLKNGKPIELIAAEEVLKPLMKAPDTFIVHSVKFKIDNGQPIMTVDYSAKNPMGVPLAGSASFIYNSGPDLPSPMSEHSSDKVRRELILNDIKDINEGKLHVEPFRYATIQMVILDNKKTTSELDTALALAYSAKLTLLKTQKSFVPHSKIGGTVTAVNDIGKIKTVAPGVFPKVYTPGKLFPWS